jgi:hypothetical protein
MKQAGNGGSTDGDAGEAKLRGDLLSSFMSPLQAGDRVSGGVILQEFLDSRNYLRRFFSTGLRPLPMRRVRSNWTSWSSS